MRRFQIFLVATWLSSAFASNSGTSAATEPLNGQYTRVLGILDACEETLRRIQGNVPDSAQESVRQDLIAHAEAINSESVNLQLLLGGNSSTTSSRFVVPPFAVAPQATVNPYPITSGPARKRSCNNMVDAKSKCDEDEDEIIVPTESAMSGRDITTTAVSVNNVDERSVKKARSNPVASPSSPAASPISSSVSVAAGPAVARVSGASDASSQFLSLNLTKDEILSRLNRFTAAAAVAAPAVTPVADSAVTPVADSAELKLPAYPIASAYPIATASTSNVLSRSSAASAPSLSEAQQVELIDNASRLVLESDVWAFCTALREITKHGLCGKSGSNGLTVFEHGACNGAPDSNLITLVSANCFVPVFKADEYSALEFIARRGKFEVFREMMKKPQCAAEFKDNMYVYTGIAADPSTNSAMFEYIKTKI